MSLEFLTQQNTSNTQEKSVKTSKPLPAWFIPLFILTGFVAVFAIVLWDDLKPSIKVDTVRAIALVDSTMPADHTKDQQNQPAQLLFQAAGWLEPEPMPTNVGVLINGTIEKLYITEGQLVKKGDKIANLNDEEYKIAVAQTHSAHMESQATIKLREAEIKTSEANIKTEEATLDATKEKLKRAEISYNRYKNLTLGTVSLQTITDAEQELREYEHLVLSGEAKIIASKTSLEQARANLESAIAYEKNADQACKKATLDLERCHIKAPINGRILRLNTTQGARVNALADDPQAGLIAVMYDPASISLKMDVPLDQAGKLKIGQQARIRCEVFPERILTGEVIRIAGEADIQRNTLQARVKIENPDDALRPGMACRAEIFTSGMIPAGDHSPASQAEVQNSQAVLIPASAIIEDESSAYVWVVSLNNKLERRPIKKDTSRNKDNMVAVTTGILPGEPVIARPDKSLKEGAPATTTNL